MRRLVAKSVQTGGTIKHKEYNMGISYEEPQKPAAIIDIEFKTPTRTFSRKVKVRASRDTSPGVNGGKSTISMGIVKHESDAEIDYKTITGFEILSEDLLEALRYIAPH